MIDIFRKVFRRNKSTDVEGNLRFYTGVSDTIISAGLFSLIFSKKLNIGEYFASTDLIEFADPNFFDNLVRFFSTEWQTIIFSFFVFIWFILYKTAVKNETEILVKLYSQFNPPHDWEDLLGQKWVPILSVGITFAFLGMAWFVDDIMKFCLIMLCLNILDIRGNNVIRQNLLSHFEDPKFIPLDNDLHKPFIMRRRKVAKDYWIWKPQIERITFMIIFALLAFTLSSGELSFNFAVWDWIPYFIIIATIIWNEYTISKWRIERDKELELIEEDQEAHERALLARLQAEINN